MCNSPTQDPRAYDYDDPFDRSYEEDSGNSDYSGDYYSQEEDDDEDRDYREWLREKQVYASKFGTIRRKQDRPSSDFNDDNWDPYNRQQFGQRMSYAFQPSPKKGLFGLPAYQPKSDYKTEGVSSSFVRVQYLYN